MAQLILASPNQNIYRDVAVFLLSGGENTVGGNPNSGAGGSRTVRTGFTLFEGSEYSITVGAGGNTTSLRTNGSTTFFATCGVGQTVNDENGDVQVIETTTRAPLVETYSSNSPSGTTTGQITTFSQASGGAGATNNGGSHSFNWSITPVSGSIYRSIIYANSTDAVAGLGFPPVMIPYVSFDTRTNDNLANGGNPGFFIAYYTVATNGSTLNYSIGTVKNAVAGAANTGDGASRHIHTGLSSPGVGGSGVAYIRYPASFPALRDVTGDYETYIFSDEDLSNPSGPWIEYRGYKFTSSATFRI